MGQESPGAENNLTESKNCQRHGVTEAEQAKGRMDHAGSQVRRNHIILKFVKMVRSLRFIGR